MKMAKVIIAKSAPNENGLMARIVATIAANASPESFFRVTGISNYVETYEVSPIMPLPDALEYSAYLQANPTARI